MIKTAGIRNTVVLASLLCSSTLARGEQVTLQAVRDNTIYEDSSGTLSNGAGEAFFAGVNGATGGSRILRGLVAFDLTSIPPGSTVTSVTLVLNGSIPAQRGPEAVSLHRVLRDWGEGTSNAPDGEAGGAPATQGDATWIHSFFNASLWDSPGGDFAPETSATVVVSANGKITWGSTAEMVADVQAWVDNPPANFGWMLRGNEVETASAKRFDSRESSVASNRPALTVDFQAPAPDLTEKLHLAQFGAGEGLQSQIVIFNPSTTSAARGTVSFWDPGGLELDASSILEQGSADFELNPLGATTLNTVSSGDVVTGSVTIASDNPLAAVIRFDLQGIGIAGVGTSVPLASAIVPVRREGLLNTGVAIRNPGTGSVTVDLVLRGEDGVQVAGGTAQLVIPPDGREARFISELFPQADTGSFRGTLSVTAQSGQVAVVGLELEAGSSSPKFTTLPVSPLQ